MDRDREHDRMGRDNRDRDRNRDRERHRSRERHRERPERHRSKERDREREKHKTTSECSTVIRAEKKDFHVVAYTLFRAAKSCMTLKRCSVQSSFVSV